jgi:DNA polymerase-3 subunit epsilon
MKSWRLGLQRRRLRKKIRDNPLAVFLATPEPSPSTTFADAELVCLDIETTGLDAASAEMLSIGWVLVRNGRVDLGSAETYVVRPSGEVGDSAIIHGLTDTFVEAGDPLSTALEKTLRALCGRVLVVHHAGLDKALLDRLCLQQYGGRLPVPVIDTMELERLRLSRRHHLEERQSLRLGDLRRFYGLPHYAAHDCLIDAIATAELLLAIVARRNNSPLKLSELYT